MGGLIVMIVLVFPHGIGGFIDIAVAPDFLPATERRAHRTAHDGDEISKVRGLCKSFGGLAAVDDVSLQVRTGELHAVIGPNGAGKTLLLTYCRAICRTSRVASCFGEKDIYAVPDRAAFPSRASAAAIRKLIFSLGFSCLGKLSSRRAIARTPPAQLAARCIELWRSMLKQARRALAAVKLGGPYR